MNESEQLFSPHRPLRMEPCRVWRTYLGGSLLSRWRGLAPQQDGHFPEDWLGSTTRANNPGREEIEEGYSILSANGGSVFQTISLKALLESDPQAYLGSDHVRAFGARTGVLVKLLDSAIRLPIQTHPDRESAQRLFGSPFGKTESWYVLDTRPEIEHPYVLLGFREGVTREQWEDVYRRQDIARMCGMLHRIEVHRGEMYLVQPGVPHAIGEGCLLVETQEPTDLVFRTEKKNAAGQLLDDDICTMGVGVDAMMELFSYRGFNARENLERYRVLPRPLYQSDAGSVECLLGPDRTDRFEVQRLQVQSNLLWQPNRFCVAIISGGSGTLCCEAGSVSVRAGETWFLPAGIRGLQWHSGNGLQALLCLPPKPDPDTACAGE